MIAAAIASAIAASCAGALRRARPGRRLSLLSLGYLALTVLLVGRLFTVQVVDAATYRGLAERQLQREIELPARRGRLLDRDGEPLALSLSAATIYANPRVLVEAGIPARSVAEPLSEVLDRPTGELTALLGKDAQFVYLGRQLPRSVGEQVAAMDLPGIGVVDEPSRAYPAGGLAAQVVGYAGIDGTGLYGLELQHDDLLAGQEGRLRLERAPGGLDIASAPREVSLPQPGADLVLTIDRHIQDAAEQALVDAVARYDALGGSAVVLDVATGEVLAMASAPGFEPDDIGDADDYARRNRAVTDVYEPGSVNKVITVAAALQEGRVRPDERIGVPNRWTIGPKTFRDAHRGPERAMTVAEIVAESSNIGTIRMAERLGNETLHRYVRAFGYGRPTGLGFPGESAGLLPAVDDWSMTSLPTIAIGQGVSATLVQVADVFATVAGGGEWRAPRLVRGRVGANGQLEGLPAPRPQRIVSAEVARLVTSMLVGVVESERGTGSLAAVPGYRVGGKTGTAQKPSTTERGYVEGAYIASFAGFAPAEDPRLVVAVMLDEPTPYYGGLSAAPVFAEIMGFALPHLRIAPSNPRERATAAPATLPSPTPSPSPGSTRGARTPEDDTASPEPVDEGADEDAEDADA